MSAQDADAIDSVTARAKIVVWRKRTMPALQHLPVSAPPEDFLAVLEEDAAVVCDGFTDSSLVAKLEAELEPIFAAAPTGGDDFSGYKTKRIGALIARSSAVREIAVNPLLLALADKILGPFCQTIQMHLTQAVSIGPGEGGQILHRDRGLWGGWIPRRIETQLGTMLAISAFTHDNGATRVVPGSQTWDRDRQPEPHEILSAEMKPGSILIYTGTVIHGGGANATNEDRWGLLMHYTLGWLRQQENQYLSCPPEIAKDFSPELRQLIGYAQGSPVMGFYSDPAGGAEAMPPEHLFGDKAGAAGKRVSAEDVVKAPR